MPKEHRGYIAMTALFILMSLPGAIGDLVQPQMVVDIMETIDMPLYVLTLMGIWKVLGVIALARPQFKRINEWAYAGFFFDLTGAAWCHAAGGDLAGVAPPLVLLAVLIGSYKLRPDPV